MLGSTAWDMDVALKSELTDEDIDELLVGVLEVPSAQRGEWLARQVGDNQAAIDELVSLAASYESSGTFLESPPKLVLNTAEQRDYTGQRIGIWSIDEEIGRGGMGRVYRAHRADGVYQQSVAIKIAPANFVQKELFVRERQILADLNHPAITRILDGGTCPGNDDLFFAMELIDGDPIVDYVNRVDPPTKDRVKFIVDLLEALDVAHHKGVIHGDIKPDNILVNCNGEVKLLDFGVARLIDEVSGSGFSDNKDDLKDNNLRAITPAFSSPQRLKGALPSVGDDIYGLGLVFGLLFAQRQSQPMAASLSSADNIACGFALDFPAELRSIYSKSVNPEQGSRYASAREFSVDILNWLEGRPVEAFHGGMPYRIGKHIKRHRYVGLSAALMVGIIALTIFVVDIKKRAADAEQVRQESVATALQLSKNISDEIELKVSQLAGSTLARLATAEMNLQRFDEIVKSYGAELNERDRARVEFEYAKALLKVSAYQFRPSGMHVGEIHQGRSNLKKAYELLYNIYHDKPNLEHLRSLNFAIRRITAHLVGIEGEQEVALARVLEVFAEAEKYQKDGVKAQLLSRRQNNILYRLHMHVGDLKGAEKYLNASTSIRKGAPADASSVMHNQIYLEELRLKEFVAIFEMVSGAFDEAQFLFKEISEEFSNSQAWIDKRRAVHANTALGCIELLASRSQPASEYFVIARALAAKLANDYPNAPAVRWEYFRLDRAEAFANFVDGATASSPIKSDQLIPWYGSFGCDDLASIHLPAPPPGGWSTITKEYDFLFKDVIRALGG